MKIIKLLSEKMIEDELDGAEEYIRSAHKYKEDYPELSRVLYDISVQEMAHIDELHAQVSRIIRDHREKHGDPPAAMMAVYEYLHDKHIAKAARIKAEQQLYKS